MYLNELSIKPPLHPALLYFALQSISCCSLSVIETLLILAAMLSRDPV